MFQPRVFFSESTSGEPTIQCCVYEILQVIARSISCRKRHTRFPSDEPPFRKLLGKELLSQAEHLLPQFGRSFAHFPILIYLDSHVTDAVPVLMSCLSAIRRHNMADLRNV